MKRSILSIAVFGTFFLSSCGGEDKGEKTEEKEVEVEVTEEVANKCHFELEEGSVKVDWVAYKFTEKAGVGGTFDEVTATGFNADKESIVFAIGSMKFSIPVATTNTGNPARDEKIKAQFFGTMTETAELSGYISSMSAGGNKEGTAGSGNLMINMNNADHEVPFTWSWENDTVVMNAEMNVNDWGAESSIDALHEVCSEKHTGEDGESILWPDVTLKATAVVHKVCE